MTCRAQMSKKDSGYTTSPSAHRATAGNTQQMTFVLLSSRHQMASAGQQAAVNVPCLSCDTPSAASGTAGSGFLPHCLALGIPAPSSEHWDNFNQPRTFTKDLLHDPQQNQKCKTGQVSPEQKRDRIARNVRFRHLKHGFLYQ